MGLLERFEDSLDRMVNGAFAKAFKAEVQPVEIAAALQREADDRAAVIDRQRTAIPNVFAVELSDHDYRRLSAFKSALQEELAALVRDYAAAQSYTLLGPVSVEISEDDELETGIFRVRSEARASVAASASASATSAEVVGQPRLEINGTAYPLMRAITRIGRGSDSDIRIDDPSASRNHCEIVIGDPTLLRDLSSTNGTMVAGERITEIALVDGAAFDIGTTTLTFRTS